jgi:hypothetical protein
MNQAASPRKKATCDQEAWVKDRIRTAVRLALAMHKEPMVLADQRTFVDAIDGIVNGTAIEILYMLGHEPSYINLKGRGEVL